MSPKRERVTLKIDRALWQRIDELIRVNPEWGVISVPEFIRRSIDSEIRARTVPPGDRVIAVCLCPEDKLKLRKDR